MVFCAVVFAQFVHGLRDFEVLDRFIDDFVENEGTTTLFGIKSCWSMDENAHFLRLANAPVQMLEPTDNYGSWQSNHTRGNWFVVKMDCDDALGFLRQVSSLSVRTFMLHIRAHTSLRCMARISNIPTTGYSSTHPSRMRCDWLNWIFSWTAT